MKILHTSDWHLGVSAEQAPREEEHRRFLDWLIAEIQERDIDVLLHSGDTFHYVQPSARCLRLYYEFLARCSRETDLCQIVVIGGNHDSPSRIDAPASILEELNVHVVGGLWGDESTWERCMCPVRRAGGDVEAVIMAVPYIHESRLGVQTAGMTHTAIRNTMVERFQHLYAKMADLAQAAYPKVPILATGHLTCYPRKLGEIEGAYHTPIHLIEALGSLPPKIFDLRYSYVALGHIHQKLEIPGPNAWYPGSPVPTDVTEARSPRHVLVVEVDPDRPEAHAEVEEVELPTWRPVFELAGPVDEVFDQVTQLEWAQELRPYLYLDMHVEAPMPDGMMKLEDLLDTYEKTDRPRLVSFKETLVQPDDFGGPDPSAFAHVPLADLTPTQVFEQMYTIRHGQPPTDKLTAAFQTLLGDEDAQPTRAPPDASASLPCSDHARHEEPAHEAPPGHAVQLELAVWRARHRLRRGPGSVPAVSDHGADGRGQVHDPGRDVPVAVRGHAPADPGYGQAGDRRPPHHVVWDRGVPRRARLQHPGPGGRRAAALARHLGVPARLQEALGQPAGPRSAACTGSPRTAPRRAS